MTENEKMLMEANEAHRKINADLRKELADVIRENEMLQAKVDLLAGKKIAEIDSKNATIIKINPHYREDILQKRIDKILEYINSLEFYDFFENNFEMVKCKGTIEKILKGEDNE